MRLLPFKRKHARARSSKSAGFTLVEIAIVIAVIGIVTSGLVIGIPQYLNQKKVEATEQKMDFLMNVLSAYVQRHYRLPCPADTTGADRGMERNGGDCLRAGNAAGDDVALFAQATGVLPWKELGLAENDVLDGWGRYITYKPAPHLTVNTYSLAMQADEDVAFPDPAHPANTIIANFSNYPDIHNACRRQTWFNGQGLHINRQKALFCCNSEPKQQYLTPTQPDPALQAVKMTNSWRRNSIEVAGTDNNDDPSDDNVVSSLQWLDDYRTTYTNNERALAGSFEKVYDSLADPPTLRASSQAVTLISHGSRGTFSYLKDLAGTQRLNAAMDPANAAAPTTDIAAAADEIKNVWPPQIFAGIIGSPKSDAYDTSGLRGDATDDIVTFLRTDQLIAKAGSASCVKPSGGKYSCARQTYDNFGYLLDTSFSMTDPFGDVTRVNRVGNVERDGNGARVIDHNQTRMDALKSGMRRVVTAIIDRELSLDPTPDNVGATGFATQINPALLANCAAAPPLRHNLISDDQNNPVKMSTGDFYLNAFLIDPSNNDILMQMDPTPGSSNNAGSTNGRNVVNPDTGVPYAGEGETIYTALGVKKMYDDDGDPATPDVEVKTQWKIFPLNNNVTVRDTANNPHTYQVAQLAKERAYNFITDAIGCGATPLYHSLIQISMHIGEGGGGGNYPGILVLSDGEDNIWRNPVSGAIKTTTPALILDTLRLNNGQDMIVGGTLTTSTDPSYPALDPNYKYFDGFDVPAQINLTRIDPATGDPVHYSVKINEDNTFTDLGTGNALTLSTGELVGALIKTKYPNMSIHILDVGNNPNLKDIAAQTSGYYVDAGDEVALNNFMSLLSSCLAFAGNN